MTGQSNGGRLAQITPGQQEIQRGGHNNGGGSGNLVNHRLDRLEERVGKMEETLNKINTLCTKIDTKLDEKANKSYVLWIFVGTLGSGLVTIVIHIAIRMLS